MVSLRASKTGLHPQADFVPTVSMFLSCSSSLFLLLWFRIWLLFWSLFDPRFLSGTLRWLCFVIVAFHGYLHVYFWN